MQDDVWIRKSMLGILALGLGLASTPATSGDVKMEKCYGIVKAGMNECGTAVHPCEGVAKTDNHPSEWIFVPEGTCKKIVNGKTEPPKAEVKSTDAKSEPAKVESPKSESKASTEKKS